MPLPETLLAAGAVGATAALASALTRPAVASPWYAATAPSFTPPRAVFPVVWTLLYAGLAVALADVLTARDAPSAALFALNLAANVAWCAAFFAQRDPLAALLPMGVLLVTTAALVLRAPSLRRRLPLAAYGAWLLFAATLNAATAFPASALTR